MHEWRDVIFLDKSMFSLQHQDSRIYVWRHRGARTLAACTLHRHSGPSPGVMAGVSFDTRLGHLFFALTAIYISSVLRPVALPFI
ncbi:hypothetical protein TNCV_2640821 [Trichonephila clavipes]|nr:hypothetical protein TNCV_2640821 [Trichonephila clavipes]